MKITTIDLRPWKYKLNLWARFRTGLYWARINRIAGTEDTYWTLQIRWGEKTLFKKVFVTSFFTQFAAGWNYYVRQNLETNQALYRSLQPLPGECNSVAKARFVDPYDVLKDMAVIAAKDDLMAKAVNETKIAASI